MTDQRESSSSLSVDEQLLIQQRQQSDNTARRMQELLRQSGSGNNEAAESAEEVQRHALQQRSSRLGTRAVGGAGGGLALQPSDAGVVPSQTSSSTSVTRAVAERGPNVAGQAGASGGLSASLTDIAAGKRRRVDSGPADEARKEARVEQPSAETEHLQLLTDEELQTIPVEQTLSKNPQAVGGNPVTYMISPDMVRGMPEQSKQRLLNVLLESFAQGARQESPPVSAPPALASQFAVPAAEPIGQHFHTLGESPSHATFPGQDMRRSMTEPASLTELSFVPSRTAGTHTRMPHISVINKMVAGHFIPLWHFSVEGVAAGFEKGQEASKSVLDKLGLEQELPKVKLQDADLLYGEMHATMSNCCAVMDRLALGRLEGNKQKQLRNDAVAWRQAMDFLFAKETARNTLTWPNMAAYIAQLRENFYADAPGERLDPREWDPELWSTIIERRQTQLTIPRYKPEQGSSRGGGGQRSDRGDSGRGGKPFQKGSA
ncbi:hypothetical protein A4X06_0g5638 [Tilletia controversa]|uniref:Uncharacterized protein n=1 Tax=Tilletia controversa TaxID=13291 RepID=A0A8X7MR81_9BASI|nr:hypothetical protein A4X06_0g5638 [Tilletia controversa]